MKRLTRAFITSLLVLSVLFSLCGCNARQTDAARAICDEFCNDVKNGDAERLITYFDGSETGLDELKEIISPSGFNSEETAFSEAVKATTRYNVQDPVYDYKAKTATVFLSWGQADYTSEAVKSAVTVPEFKTAIASAPENIITVSVTVDLNGETPRIVNPKDVIDAVYAFNTVDHGIMPGMLSDYYLDGSFVLAPKGIYTNTKEIGIRLNFDESLFSYIGVPGIVYTVAMEKDVLFTSDVITLEENSIRLDFNSEMAGEKGLSEDGFLLAGEYTFMVFDEHSKDLASFTCTVVNENVEKETFEFDDHKEDYYLSNLVYEFKDSDLMGDTFVYNSGWWDYDGTSVGKSAFASNTKVLGFSLAVSSDNDSELYYEYYYSEESDFEGINESGPVYQGSCKPSLYDDQSCYDLDYSAEEFKPGFYGLVVYGDKAKKHIVFTAACIVVEESSEDVLE